MADHILQTTPPGAGIIIQLRYGTYTQWMNSSVILRQGEAAICAFPNNRTIQGMSNSTPEHTPPAVGIKIGDGSHYFSELPWLQGVAADVYNWAKEPTKPTYTAAEIGGLASYIEEHFNFGGDVTIAPRVYQIVEGTGDDVNKYYLRYKENSEDSPWITDTNHAIDLTDYAKVVSWIGRSTMTNPNFPSLGNYVGQFIRSIVNVTDTAVTNMFVTSVSWASGVQTVTRARPTFDNISGTLTVSRGGTGLTTLTENTVLVGNGTNNVTLIPIADSIANNNYFVPNRIIKNYVDTAVAGLEHAMHYIGEATVVINNNANVDPRIEGYTFSKAQPGDVIIYDTKEFLWTGGQWKLFGDEGTYAVKGSIKDIDIDPEAAIAQSKISGLIAALNSKVDKEENKTLTSNDFTDEYKLKLDGIAIGAQVNTIENIILNGTRLIPTTINNYSKAINLEISEFDDASRLKLNGIAAGAQVNVIEGITYDGSLLSPNDSKIITITPNHHPEHENKIEAIFLNEREWRPNADKEVHITLDQAALNLNVLEGAQIPPEEGSTLEEVTQVNKKLQLNRIAVTADVKELRQTANTYIVLDCGTSESDAHPTS